MGLLGKNRGGKGFLIHFDSNKLLKHCKTPMKQGQKVVHKNVS